MFEHLWRSWSARASGPTRSHKSRKARTPNGFQPRLEPLEDRRLLAVITVTGTGDTTDVDGLVTLREAILSANGNSDINTDVVGVGAYGMDTINFDIPGMGVQTIMPLSALPTISGPVVIDGYTQPGASPNTLAVGNDAVLLVELNGAQAGAGANGLTISAGSSTVQGLVINRFKGHGVLLQASGGNVIQGNYLGTNVAGTAGLGNDSSGVSINGVANNTIGGATFAARNVISGNKINGILISGAAATGNLIQGNYIGTSAAGTAAIANTFQGIAIADASNTTIGGTTSAARNVISGNADYGIFIQGTSVTGTLIQGNYVGLTAAGTAALGNANAGIILIDAPNNTIGGAAAGNVISANASHGIQISGSSATGNTVQGNLIGTDKEGGIDLGNQEFGVLLFSAPMNMIGGTTAAARNVISGNNFDGIAILGSGGTGNTVLGNHIGTDLTGSLDVGNSGHGIKVETANNTIGGTLAGAANTIAFNGGDGVFVSAGTGNAILTNSIHSNTGLGIDLGTNGVTPNDNLDVDAGANNLQNFPAITGISSSGGMTTIQGTLRSTPNTLFRIELFDNTAGDPSGHGEGRFFLGAVSGVMTDGAGNATFSFMTPDPLPGNRLIAATATDPGNNTSEFGCSLIVTTTDDSGPGSLREAIECANENPGLDTITFAIPGLGVQTISPLSPLPSITDPVVIDGYTQPGASANTMAGGDNAVLLIELNGTGAGSSDGLDFFTGNSTVRGLVINRFERAGIRLQQDIPATFGNNVIEGNFIGTDPTGLMDLGNNLDGVLVFSFGNRIGGSTPAARNVVSGNEAAGVALQFTSNLNVVLGNFIGTNKNGTGVLSNDGSGVYILNDQGSNTIGGSAAVDRNLISGNFGNGVEITVSTGPNFILGNYIGTDVTGTIDLGNAVSGVVIDRAPNTRVGGTRAGESNLISGNNSHGIVIASTTGGLVQGNRIGTDVTGLLPLENSEVGIIVIDASLNTIGGTTAAARNIVSGNGSQGVFITGSLSFSNVVQGNFIGTDITGLKHLGNGSKGVYLEGGASSNTIGGTAVGAGNTIAFNDGVGIAADFDAGNGNAFLGNSIYANESIGIDLNFDFVTDNDLGDPDSGPNNLQNFPLITLIGQVGGNTSIQGTLNSTPNTQFHVELFANDMADPSGFGEGQTFLGFVDVTTDGSGNADIDFTATGIIPAGRSVTATATDPDGSTSEFSNALCSLIVTTTADGGFGSLREAILCANERPGADTILVPAGTYTLSIGGADEDAAASGDLDITDDLTIIGVGAATTIIQAGTIPGRMGNGIDRVFDIIASAANVTLSDLTIRNGLALGDGGGVRNDSHNLVLANLVVSDNVAEDPDGNPSAGGDGGGIANTGTIVLNNTSLSILRNFAERDGGGIANNSGVVQMPGANPLAVTLTIDNNESDNNGGGILQDNGSFTVFGTIALRNNDSALDGGGAGGFNSSTLDLRDVNNAGVISNNRAASFGGGVFNGTGGVARLEGFSIRDNHADGNGGGLGQFNLGQFTVTGGDISNNTADGDGGGIAHGGPVERANGSTFVVNNVLVQDNDAAGSGGGIAFHGEDATFTFTGAIRGNTAQGVGAGVFFEGDRSTFNLTGVVFQNDSEGDGGGIYLESGNLSQFTVMSSSITENNADGFGGGIFSSLAPSSQVIVTGSTLDGNIAGPGQEGGGLWNSTSTVIVTNSTFSGNRAGAEGGGIYQGVGGGGGSITLLNVTVTLNVAPEGGGLYNDATGNVRLTNSLVANNRVLVGVPEMESLGPGSDLDGPFISGGHNLIGNGDGGTGFMDGVNGDQVGSTASLIDAKLGPLDDNGGPTQTHALLMDSPAIDEADINEAPATDQRGIARPQGPAPDIGAFESEEFAGRFLTIDDVVVVEGDAGAVNAVFTVTLSAPASVEVTVVFTTDNVTATAGLDYQATTGVLTFAPMQTVQNVTVPVLGDTLVEADEVFRVDLSTAVNATIDDGIGLGTILDDDAPPALSIDDRIVTEGNLGTVEVVFSVTLSAPSGLPISVVFATANGSATAGNDYLATTGTLSFAPSETSLTVTVQVNGDVLDEFDETFTVNLSSPTNATILDGQGLGTILDDDAAPSLSINDRSVTEGNQGAAAAVFSVTLSAPSGKPITVVFTTNDGSATAGGDYLTTSGTLTFTALETIQTVTVQVNGDTLDELDETFTVNLSSVTNATILDGQGLGTILDDDAPPTVSINDRTVTEGNAGTVDAVFTVALSAQSGLPISVVFATANGSATAGSDYLATSGTLSFAPLEVSKTITVQVNGDLLDELNETFFVNLSNVTNATLLDGQGLGTIVDDDAPPSMSINDLSVIEGNTGTIDAVFTVTLSAQSGLPISVVFTTADASAIAGADYVATTGTLSFGALETIQTVTVRVSGDAIDEFDETFTVNLSNATNATIADSAGLGTILDNDAEPTLSINDVSVTEGNSLQSTAAVFAFTLSAPSGKPISFAVLTAGGTAQSGSDFIGIAGTFSFAPGETSRNLPGAFVNGDTVDELDETFFVNLSNPTNVTILDGQGLGTILDDDAPPALSINDVSVVEGNSGSVGAVFSVTLSAPSSLPISVVFTTADVTAIGTIDYQPTSGTLSFAPGQVSQNVTVLVNGDIQAEPNEFFAVNLSSPTNATFAPGVQGRTSSEGFGTILDDDARSLFVTGADAGGGPHVKVFDASNSQLLFGFMAYNPLFGGGVRVAVGDVNGDGFDDVITGAGPGGGPHVRVFDGRNGAQLPGFIGSFMAYNPLFGGGVYVASADVNGDGAAEVITGADAGGGPHVRVFDGRTGAQLAGRIGSFFAYKAEFNGGVRVAAGDVNGDGLADVITGMGPGYGDDSERTGFKLLAQPEVRVFSSADAVTIRSFLPFEPGYRGGVHLSVGHIDADGKVEIIVGKANGDARTDAAFDAIHINPFRRSEVSVFQDVGPGPLNRLQNFVAYPHFPGSVRVAAVDRVFRDAPDFDPTADYLGPALLTAPGRGGGPHVKLLADDLSLLDEFFAYDELFGGGVFVAGSVGGPPRV